METIKGTVERVTYYNPDNGYGVIKIKAEARYPAAEARDGTITVVGAMPELGVGEDAQFDGEWVENATYGRQFKAETVTPIMPTTEDGIVNYLSSGIVKGIGPKTAQRIVDTFGSETLYVLDNHPERLSEVPGLKNELARQLARAWVENQAARQAMIFLQGYGVSSRMAARIYANYGMNTVAAVRENPYALADEVMGIGFMRADAVAQSMGLPADSTHRVQAGLQYALNQAASDGHVYLPRGELVAKALELLKIDNRDRVEAAISQQVLIGDLIADDEIAKTEMISDQAIYLPLYYHTERGAADRVRRLNAFPSPVQEEVASLNWHEFLHKLSTQNAVELSVQQQSAVRAALTNKVSVLTGGPGTGKTTTLRMVIHALEAIDCKYALASPTGRAAKRLSEATGRSASTIHRLLGYVPGEGFDHDEDNPLKIDMLIVDEASMIDALLFNDVLKAIPPEAHMLLVGDIDQLPSVGAGNVLRDVIASEAAHVTRLDVIFRQDEASHIIVNAHRINNGDAPFMDNKSKDFFFFGEDDPMRAGELVVDIVVNRLPNRFGIDPRDVQVIAPMYRGPVGVNALNEALQKALNGSKRTAEKKIAGKLFRAGDKVMQTRNNYDKQVYNGDIGRIEGIDFTDQAIEVNFDNEYVYYDFVEADELIHAYCISTHRSQGSEYPVVVVPLLTQHYMMLQRNLVYTAVTRAKQMVVLVGSRKAVYMAVENNKVSQRYTGLRQRLRS